MLGCYRHTSPRSHWTRWMPLAAEGLTARRPCVKIANARHTLYLFLQNARHAKPSWQNARTRKTHKLNRYLETTKSLHKTQDSPTQRPHTDTRREAPGKRLAKRETARPLTVSGREQKPNARIRRRRGIGSLMHTAIAIGSEDPSLSFSPEHASRCCRRPAYPYLSRQIRGYPRSRLFFLLYYYLLLEC